MYNQWGNEDMDEDSINENRELDEEPYDDFPMYMEYETAGNAGDFWVEQTAQDEGNW